MNNQRFIFKLNNIINKVHNSKQKEYICKSSSLNEDYDYLLSLENYLIDYANKHNLTIEFFISESSAYSFIRFKYNNNLYLLEHCEKSNVSYMSISLIENNQLNDIQKNNIVNLI